MARRRIGQWGIAFRVAVYSGGYEWRAYPPAGDDAERLCLRNPPVPGQMDGSYLRVQRGLEVARKAFNAFLALSRGLCDTANLESQREMITAFANAYGTLWGHWSPRTVGEWCREATDFLDMHDVSRSIRTGQFAEFDRQVGTRHSVSNPDRQTGMTYFSRYRPGSLFEIAGDRIHVDEVEGGSHTPWQTLAFADMPGRVADMVGAMPEGWEVVDRFEDARRGTSRQRAVMLLANVVNKKLRAGLSFEASPMIEEQFAVTNDQLVHLLYLRLWLTTVTRQDVDRVPECLECGTELNEPGVTRRRKFCGDVCRTAYHNRRRARSR